MYLTYIKKLKIKSVPQRIKVKENFSDMLVLCMKLKLYKWHILAMCLPFIRRLIIIKRFDLHYIEVLKLRGIWSDEIT